MNYQLLSCLSLFDRTIVAETFSLPEPILLNILENAKTEHLDGAQEALKLCEESHSQIFYPGHPQYPEEFLHTSRPPTFLNVKTRAPSWLWQKSIAVVGSREPTPQAMTWMEQNLPTVIASEAIVLSGGAKGVDQKAHQLAIRAKKPTVVFLPSGLLNPYPVDWCEWEDALLNAGGALVSTYHPKQEIRRAHFERRNELIVALSKVVFVVEARRRSGTSMTARLAKERERTICVLPGRPGDFTCAGNVDLLFEGALPIRDGADLQILLSISSMRGEG